MAKNPTVYSLLNDIQIDSEDYEVIEMSEFDKQQMLKQFRQSKHANKKLVKGKSHPIRTALLLVAAIGTIFLIQPNFTRQITATVANFLQDVQMNLSQTLFGADSSANSESFFEVSDAQMFGEIPIKLEDLYVTESTISYNILLYYPQADAGNDKFSFGGENIYINEEQMDLIPSEIKMGFVPDQEGLYQFTHTYYLPESIDMTDEINIALELKDLKYVGQGENPTTDVYQESVIFKVNTSGEELLADSKTIESSEIISTDLADFSFEEIVLNPGYSRIMMRANLFNPDQIDFFDYTYKLRIDTDTAGTAYFTRWNSPGQQADGSHLVEFRFDEANSDISLTELLEASSLELQLMQFEGMKGSVEDFEDVGNAVNIQLD